MVPDQGNIDVEVTYFRSNQDFLENPDMPMELKMSFLFPRNTTLGDVRLKIARTMKQRHDEGLRKHFNFYWRVKLRLIWFGMLIHSQGRIYRISTPRQPKGSRPHFGTF